MQRSISDGHQIRASRFVVDLMTTQALKQFVLHEKPFEFISDRIMSATEKARRRRYYRKLIRSIMVFLITHSLVVVVTFDYCHLLQQ